MSDNWSEIRTQYMLSALSNLGGNFSGTEDEIAKRLLNRKINPMLNLFANDMGDWEVVWGPGIFIAEGWHDSEEYADNTMYVAYNDDEKKYAICIAGTAANSTYDWLELNFGVQAGKMVSWEYGNDFDENVKIAHGTYQGLQNLLGMEATDSVPGAGTTLEAFLRETIDPREKVEVITNGISLGGALSPTLALWLVDRQSDWNPSGNATISTWPFAGPTTGNQAFKEYSDERLPDTNRVANTLDVVPHAWKWETLDEVPTLYLPDIPELDVVDLLVKLAKLQTRSDVYQHVGPEGKTQILEGVFKPEVDFIFDCKENGVFCQFVDQILYQHISGYWDLLDGPPEFDSVVEQMQEQFNKQIQTHLPEFMEYVKSQP